MEMFSLEGKVAIVTGASSGLGVAFAQACAQAGADVVLYAPQAEIGEEMAVLLAGGPAAGSITHLDRPWALDSFALAALAVGDCETEAEAQAFACAARAAGVPCNVVDKPDFCSFRFGTIVNRSPAVIGISTDGAAPILGQAIRRRIETLLPRALAGWAGLAAAVRSEVMARLEPGQAFEFGHQAASRHGRLGTGTRQQRRIEQFILRRVHDISPARSKIGMYSSTTMAPTTRPMAAISSGSKVRVKRSIQRVISPS